MSQPSVIPVVSVSIIQDGKVLLIKENKAIARNQWNFPSGKMEPGENILDAARREVKEETGYDVRLTGTTGVYNFVSVSGNQVILFHFIGTINGGTLRLDEAEIVDSKWVTLSELLESDSGEIREAAVIKRIVGNLIHGNRYSLDLFIDIRME